MLPADSGISTVGQRDPLSTGEDEQLAVGKGRRSLPTQTIL